MYLKFFWWFHIFILNVNKVNYVLHIFILNVNKVNYVQTAVFIFVILSN